MNFDVFMALCDRHYTAQQVMELVLLCIWRHFSQMNVSACQTSQCHNPENVLCGIFAINVVQISGKDVRKSIFCKTVALT